MSVTIDLLKKKNGRPAPLDSSTQRLLAETYLRSSDEMPRRSSGRKKTDPVSSADIMSSLPLILISFVIIVIAFIVIRSFHVDISVTTKNGALYQDLLSSQKIELIGSAKLTKGSVTLADDDGIGPDGIAIDIAGGLDLSKNNLLISVFAKKGRVSLRVVLRDKNHRSFISDTLRVEQTGRGRQNFVISGDRPKESIDISDIRQVRVELQQEDMRDSVGSAALLEKVLIIANK